MIRAAAAAIALVMALAASGCTFGCPTALATGVLTANGPELALRADTGELLHVRWPDGIIVRSDGDRLVLADPPSGPIVRRMVRRADQTAADRADSGACVRATRPLVRLADQGAEAGPAAPTA